jgi:16S rRNA (guanine966-N2)-methyltransferase
VDHGPVDQSRVDQSPVDQRQAAPALQALVAMRIVAGRHRGRALAAPEGRDIRPTSERLREAVFNILAHGIPSLPAEARVLDVFAGTGALGLEALSRGAAHVTFIETDKAATRLIRYNLATLGETANADLLARDAERPGSAPAGDPATLAFLDPPYRSGLAEPALAALGAGGWLAEGARIIIELAHDEAFTSPSGFTEDDSRIYGKSRVVFLTWGDPA